MVCDSFVVLYPLSIQAEPTNYKLVLKSYSSDNQHLNGTLYLISELHPNWYDESMSEISDFNHVLRFTNALLTLVPADHPILPRPVGLTLLEEKTRKVSA